MITKIFFILLNSISTSQACVGPSTDLSIDTSKSSVTLEDGTEVNVISQVSSGNITWIDDNGQITMLSLIAADKYDSDTLKNNRALFDKAFNAFKAEVELVAGDLSSYCGGTQIQEMTCRQNFPELRASLPKSASEVTDLKAFEKLMKPAWGLINIGQYGAYSYNNTSGKAETAENSSLNDHPLMPAVSTFTERAAEGFQDVQQSRDVGCGGYKIVNGAGQKADDTKGTVGK